MVMTMPLALVRRVIAMLAMRVIMVIMRILMPMIMRVVMIVMAAMLIVHMRRLFFQKVRVNVQLGIQIKAPQIKHLGQRHLAKVHHLLRCPGIHVRQTVLQSFQLRL